MEMGDTTDYFSTGGYFPGSTVRAWFYSPKIFNSQSQFWTCLMKSLHKNSDVIISTPALKNNMMVAIIVRWELCSFSFVCEWTDNRIRPTVNLWDYRLLHPLQFHLHSPPVFLDLLHQGSKVDMWHFKMSILHQLMYELILRGSMVGWFLALYPECYCNIFPFGELSPYAL